MPFVMLAGAYISFCLVSQGGRRDTQNIRRLLPVQFPGLPLPVYLVEDWRQGLWRPTEPDTSGFGCGDPLGLPLTNVATLVLRYEGEHLQDDVAEERPDKVFPTPGIQKGHVDYADVDTLFLCQDAPLFQYLGVVPAQAVNALDIEQITPFQLPQQLPVLRPLEVLSTLLIRIDIAILNTVFVHGNDLSVFILIFCADSHITIAIAQSFLLSVKPAAGLTIY